MKSPQHKRRSSFRGLVSKDGVQTVPVHIHDRLLRLRQSPFQISDNYDRNIYWELNSLAFRNRSKSLAIILRNQVSHIFTIRKRSEEYVSDQKKRTSLLLDCEAIAIQPINLFEWSIEHRPQC